MKLQKVQESIALFKDFLRTEEAYANLYLYEGIKIFGEAWDVSAEPLSKMYLSATENSTSKRMWKYHGGHPREVMSAFMHFDPIYSKFMFNDLFSEGISVDSRLGRFIFHADQLYAELEHHFLDGPHSSHYHDRKITSIYLAYHNPRDYLIYDWELFSSFIPFLEMANPPAHENCSRYYRICKTLGTFVLKDAELIRLHQRRLNPEKQYSDSTLSMVYELMHAVSSYPMF